MSLPSEYLKLKYIASTGTQWIETNVPASSTDIITIKGKYDAYWTSDNHVELMGCHNSGTYFRIGIIENDSVKKFFATTGYWNEYTSDGIGIYGRGYPVAPADLNEHTFIYNFAHNTFTIDSTIYNLGTNTGSRSATGTNMVLFAYRQDGYYGVGAKSTFKLESCVIEQGGQIVRDFLPVLRKSDMKPGLYDLVNDVFYINQNQTGDDFAYEIDNSLAHIMSGEEKNNYKTTLFSGPTKSIIDAIEGSTSYLPLEWIGSTGTQYIITDIIPQIEYNIEVKAQKELGTGLFGVGSGSYALTGRTDKNINYFYVGRNSSSSSDRQIVQVDDQSAVHIWGIRDKVGYCDGVSATAIYGTYQPTDNLAFFGRYYQGGISDLGTHRIYYAKIWDASGTLIGDFEPKIQLSTGKPGLYDNVTNVFYPNAGSGEFTYELNSYQTAIYHKGE